jgi:cell wall-associated NlpC family hydrolase
MSFNIIHRTPHDARILSASGLKRVPFEKGLFEAAVGSGAVTSDALQTPAPFTSVVPSWNATVPAGGVLGFQVRARLGGRWSRWYDMGESRGGLFYSPPSQEDADGLVDIDTLKLRRPADALRYRATLKADGGPVTLKLVALAFWDGKAAPSGPYRPGPWVREIKVRPRSQKEEQEKYKHDICSPTTLAMLLSYWRRDRPTAFVAEKVRDQTTRLFGDWSANMYYAGSQNLLAFAARLGSLAALERLIAAGRPVAASLTFGPGELDGAPLKKTKGHFVLVVGFSRAGDVICLDPAAASRAVTRRVYRRDQFYAAWLVNKGGLAYIAWPLKGSLMEAADATVDVWSKPQDSSGASSRRLHDPSHLTQLLYAEPARLKKVRGDWVGIEALQQRQFRKGRGWSGYAGWAQAGGLVLGLPAAPADAVVLAKQPSPRGSAAAPKLLSVGTRLSKVSSNRSGYSLRLLDGSAAAFAPETVGALDNLDEKTRRRRIVQSARLFLGERYYWGGRSGVQFAPDVGVDCSGLVELAYRAAGMDIPRNARDQKRAAHPARREDLHEGDLVFLTASERSRRINHVMIYAGGDRLLESSRGAGRALATTFKERFRQTLAEIESGVIVMDFAAAKPRRRRIFFGTFF